MRFPPSHPRRRGGFIVAILHRRWPYLWAVVVGVVFAVRVIGWDFLTGDPAVVRVVAGDNAAGLAAFRAYVDDGWRWPLLYTPAFGDRGVNMAFSDSIPVLAIVAKLARPFGIGAEAWWAAWFWAVYGLQGVAATFAVRSWGGRSTVVQLAAPVLALSMPVLLVQTVHPSLSAQSVILASWGLAGRLRTDDAANGTARRIRLGFGALSLGALMIHPYLAAMVLVFQVGSGIDRVIAGQLSRRALARSLALTTTALGLWLWVGGYLTSFGPSEGGYGLYAAAVAGPFVPVLSDVAGRSDGSLEVLPTHAGYAYLGLGLIVLAGAAAWLGRPRLPGFVVGNQALLLGLVALSIWAVSPFVRVGLGQPVDLPAALALRTGSFRSAGALAATAGLGAGLVAGALWVWLRHRSRLAPAVGLAAVAVLVVSAAGLVAPSLVAMATSQFRASGRFAWPALYAVLVLGLASLARPAVAPTAGQRAPGVTARPAPLAEQTAPRVGRPATGWLGAAVVSVAVTLQVVDTTTLRSQSREFLVPGGDARRAYVDTLVELVEGHESVRLGPDFRCTYYPDGVTTFIDVTAAASAADRPIDRIYAARGGPPEVCSVPQHPDLADPGTLVVLIEPVSLAHAENTDEVVAHCRTWGTLNACSHRWQDLTPEVAAFFGPLVD